MQGPAGRLAMFMKDTTRRAFEARLNTSIGALTPADGIEAMIRFFEEDLCADALPADEDGDVLLFQWGTYDWSGSVPPNPEFEVSLTRQLSFADGEDVEIRQLALRFLFAPDPDLGALGRGETWCFNRADLHGFRANVLGSPALGAVRGLVHRAADLRWEAT